MDYDDTVRKHSSDTVLTDLEEIKIYTDQGLPQVASKPYPLPLKHHKFVNKNTET